MAQLLEVSPPTLRKGQSITNVHFKVIEHDGVPMTNTFNVTLTRTGPDNQSVTVLSWPHNQLLANGTFDTTYVPGASPLNVAGIYTYNLVVNPLTGSDMDPTNNTQSASVEVLYQPLHAHPLPFTPNGDGYNDSLYFDFGDDRFRSPTASIFTIDGRLLADLTQVNNNAIAWLGVDKSGRACAPGAYLFIFKDGDTKVSSGLIYLAR